MEAGRRRRRACIEPIAGTYRSSFVASLATLVACSLGTALLGPGRAAAEDPRRQAEALIRRGIELREAGADDAAVVEFRKAYQLAPAARTAAQLGLSEQALGRWEDAEAHLTEALRSRQDPWVVKHQATLRASLTNIKGHVGRVEVIGEPDGAEVFVNGRPVGKVPIAEPIHVRAGQVFIELRAPGFVRAIHRAHVTGGQFQSVVVRLERERSPAPISVATTAPPAVAVASVAAPPGHGEKASGGDVAPAPLGAGASDPEGGRAVPGRAADPRSVPRWRVAAKWAALGLAVGGLGLGTVEALVANQRRKNFDNAFDMTCTDVRGRALHRNDGSEAAECQPLLDSFQTARTWQVVGWAAGGAFTATWLALALTERSAADSTGHAARATLAGWVCLATVSRPGVACQLRF